MSRMTPRFRAPVSLPSAPLPPVRHALIACASSALLLAACSGEKVEDREPPNFEDSPSADPSPPPIEADAQGAAGNDDSDADAAPAGAQRLISVEGRVSTGAECPIIETPDGTVYALGGERTYEDGARLHVEGEIARASFCMQGEGTLVPLSIEELSGDDEMSADAPMRLALTGRKLAGRWIASGGDCAAPAFTITQGEGGTAPRLTTDIRGETKTGTIDLGPAPSIRLDGGMMSAAIEPRGTDDINVTPPAGGTIELGGEMVLGAGRTFEKCPAG